MKIIPVIKRPLTLLLTLALVLPLFAASGNGYTDSIPLRLETASDWAREYINTAYGYGFRPDPGRASKQIQR